MFFISFLSFLPVRFLFFSSRHLHFRISLSLSLSKTLLPDSLSRLLSTAYFSSRFFLFCLRPSLSLSFPTLSGRSWHIRSRRAAISFAVSNRLSLRRSRRRRNRATVVEICVDFSSFSLLSICLSYNGDGLLVYMWLWIRTLPFEVISEYFLNYIYFSLAPLFFSFPFSELGFVVCFCCFESVFYSDRCSVDFTRFWTCLIVFALFGCYENVGIGIWSEFWHIVENLVH